MDSSNLPLVPAYAAQRAEADALSEGPAGADFHERLRVVQESAHRQGGRAAFWQASYTRETCRISDDPEFKQVLAEQGLDPSGCYLQFSPNTTLIALRAGYVIALLGEHDDVLGLWAFDRDGRAAVLLVAPGDWGILALKERILMSSNRVNVPARGTPLEGWRDRCDLRGVLEPGDLPSTLVEQVVEAGYRTTESVPVCVDLDESR